MLILTRKPGERIIIRPSSVPVYVTLVQIQQNKVRLGIEAPREVEVHREEIWAATAKERILGAATKGRLAELRDRMDCEENREAVES